MIPRAQDQQASPNSALREPCDQAGSKVCQHMAVRRENSVTSGSATITPDKSVNCRSQLQIKNQGKTIILVSAGYNVQA